jgi:Ca2+-binding RTX toxin-like protein
VIYGYATTASSVTDLIRLAIAPTGTNWSVANNVGPPSTAAFGIDGIASSYGFTIYATDDTTTAATEANVEAGVVVNIAGTGASEYLAGGLNNDTISGGSGNDMLGGIGRKETITIASYDPGDTVKFTANGVDSAVVTAGSGGATSNELVASALADNINATSATSFVTAKADGAVVTVTYLQYAGTAGATTLTNANGGTAMSATVDSSIAADYGAGNDSIAGNDGNDTLIGGAGADTLTGGAGNDQFVHNIVSAATPTSNSATTAPDVITDFAYASDTIKLVDSDASNSRVTFAKGADDTSGTVTDGLVDVLSTNGVVTSITKGNGTAAVALTIGTSAEVDTLDEVVALINTDYSSDGTVVTFAFGADSYVFIQNGAADGLIKLAGVTGLTSETISSGVLTLGGG